jgi:hypothetical protein
VERTLADAVPVAVAAVVAAPRARADETRRVLIACVKKREKPLDVSDPRAEQRDAPKDAAAYG